MTSSSDKVLSTGIARYQFFFTGGRAGQAGVSSCANVLRFAPPLLRSATHPDLTGNNGDASATVEHLQF